MEKSTKSENKTIEKKITSRAKDYSQWYLDIINAADLAESAPVRGCMIIKPYGYAIWENIQKILDAKIKETGVENAYFPLLIPESFLEKEAKHVEGFSPECAVVTHAGGKKLKEPLVVRPTSETIIYDVYSRWIESYRDLPLLINQWANIVRWEMRPRLFLRTTEFLWQEGHTAHATLEEAEERTKQMLFVYKDLAEQFIALPTIVGMKPDFDKFAGADHTYAIEAMMQDGKALQAGTSHLLGQNFAKAFDIQFLDKDGKKKYVWQTSWGVSTRLIGALIMAHSDDKGLILPPKIAPIHVVIIPIWTSEKERSVVMKKVKEIKDEISGKEVIIKIDERDMRPGPKFFEWEKKGVPIRLEVGPKDIAKKSVVSVRRDTGEKKIVSEKDISAYIKKTLDDIQKNIFDKALKFQKENTHSIDNWDKFKAKLNKEGGFVSAHWCGDAKCETKVKNETKATIRCIPFDQKKEKEKCVVCGKGSEQRVVYAKAY